MPDKKVRFELCGATLYKWFRQNYFTGFYFLFFTTGLFSGANRPENSSKVPDGFCSKNSRRVFPSALSFGSALVGVKSEIKNNNFDFDRNRILAVHFWFGWYRVSRKGGNIYEINGHAEKSCFIWSSSFYWSCRAINPNSSSSVVMVGSSRPQFVLFGSSIVQYSFSNGGWGATLADIYARKADIMLRGYTGWNSRRALQILDQVFPKDAATQPSLVIVYFGGNDSIGYHSSGLGPHVPLSEYIENMRKIGNHLKNLSENIRIIFLSCPPVNEDKLRQSTSNFVSEIVRSNETCRRYSEACIELCKEMDLKVVDLWTAIQKRDDWGTSCLTDGIHFSSEGSNIVVEEILKVLKEADWEPSLHWKSLPTEFSEDSPYDLVAIDEMTTLNISEATFHRQIQWD